MTIMKKRRLQEMVSIKRSGRHSTPQATSLLTPCRAKPRSAQLRAPGLNKRGGPNGCDFCYRRCVFQASKSYGLKIIFTDFV